MRARAGTAAATATGRATADSKTRGTFVSRGAGTNTSGAATLFDAKVDPPPPVLPQKSWSPKDGVMPQNGGHPASVLDGLVLALSAAGACGRVAVGPSRDS